MAATDQHYRSPKTLDLVFGVSCGVMLLTTFWMFYQDYARDYKTVQRTFRDVEATIAEREMIDRMPDVAVVREKRDAAKAARDALEAEQARLKTDDMKLKAEFESVDASYRGVKADYDAQMSYYNIAIDEVGKVPLDGPRHKPLKAAAEVEKEKLAKIEEKLAVAKSERDKVELRIKNEIRFYLEPLEKQVSDKDEDLKKTTTLFDRYAKQAAKTAWTRGDTFRMLPIIDGAESPTKIKQIWLPELTIDYSFKDVPRYDRCTTCHLGIERASYDREMLAKLGDEAENDRLTGKVVEAQSMLKKRADAGETLGFNPGDLPGKPHGAIGKLTLLILACVLVAAVSLGVLEWSLRLGLRVMFLGTLLTLVSALVISMFSPTVPAVKTVKLSEGQITQYAAHPRLDLFVDSNSAHPMEKFGCTICHAGQGSATEFTLASHAPNDTKQEKAWEHLYGWRSSHYWDYPMLQKRFVESSCLKCHHQVTDLIRHGNKEEAPKLLRGYNLVKEMGCFGCHEIQGNKGGRSVGPDLRLEPAPALDWLSAAEQERVKNDAANSPGNLRKVGPSLRRLSEKVGAEWTRKWIADPRGYRDDTRMPHFYNLSTNDEKYLKAEDDENAKKNKLYQAQAKFPSTEIHAIAHYLLHESRQSLAGKDTYREVLLRGKNNLTQMQKLLAEQGTTDKEIKDLFDVSKRFADLALLSAPTNATAINARSAQQRQLQERVQELQRKMKDSPDDATKAALSAAASELASVTAALEKLALPTPIATRIVGEDGSAVAFPDMDGNANAGRKLFTEKGCLACHAHNGTTTKDEANKTPAVVSDANFGPELSRMADKLLLGRDKKDARRWLVQWVMNPNVYHPRTRMPITHLSATEANDVAEWILTQKSDWKAADPAAPDAAAVRALTRLHLSRAPGMTKADVDAFVPAEGTPKGIAKERIAAMPRDADERELAEGKLTNDKMMWYVGKRAVGRLGCFGCHDVPGFETAKPIGTGLNDWGKKDHDKLAFEDGESWAKEHFTIVPTRTTRQQAEAKLVDLWKKGAAFMADKGVKEGEASDKEKFAEWLASVKDVTGVVESDKPVELVKEAVGNLSDPDQVEVEKLNRQLTRKTQERIAELEKKKLDKGLTAKEEKEYEEMRPWQFFEPAGGKMPMEESFYQALEHHHREGFLHLKLAEPRSYDFNRIKAWDDRLRMPQFKFARSRKKTGETDPQYKARMEADEAEAREAVMTFVLGLVADPVPLKYVNTPKADKAAEVLGRQILDKYNCGGCHQIRPGVYDFKREDVIKTLEAAAKVGGNLSRLVDDFHFPNTTAWAGAPQTGERMQLFGLFDAAESAKNEDSEDPNQKISDTFRLVDALRFTGTDGVERNMPAGLNAWLPRGKYKATPAYGGKFVDLMLSSKYLTTLNKDKYPTPQGHLPPSLIREGERVQPDWLYKFLLNPAPVRPTEYLILRMPKFNMSPDESRMLVNYFASTSRLTNPAQGVTAPFVQIDQRDAEFWKHAAAEYRARLEKAPDEVKRLKAEVERVQKAAADAKNKNQATDAARLEGLKKELAYAETVVPFAKEQLEAKAPKGAKASDDVYSRQAYKLLTNRDLCLKCHNVGSITIEGAQGPNLMLAAERLRPEWMEQWIAKPSRMFGYEPVMPQNFPNKPDPLAWVEQKTFVGTPLQQTKAVRDVLMDGPRLSELIATIPPPPPPKDKDAPKEKDKDAKEKDKGKK